MLERPVFLKEMMARSVHHLAEVVLPCASFERMIRIIKAPMTAVCCSGIVACRTTDSSNTSGFAVARRDEPSYFSTQTHSTVQMKERI